MILLVIFFCLPILASCGPHHFISDLTFIGTLKTIQYGVRGHVYALDHHTIVIQDFHYNGLAMDAVFWAGESDNLEALMDTVVLSPDGQFYTFFDDAPFLEAYYGETVTLTLPERINVEDLKFLTVWSKYGARDLGFITFPEDVHIPGGDAEFREPKEIDKEEEEEEDDYLIPINFDDDMDNIFEEEDPALTLNEVEQNIADLERNLAKMKNQKKKLTGDTELIVDDTAGTPSRSVCSSLLTLGIFVLMISN